MDIKLSKDVIILRDYRGFVRQGEFYVSSLNIEKIKLVLESKGFKVQLLYFDEIINDIENIKEKIVLYSSSENSEYKAYIDDILYILSRKNTLIPSYEMFKAHENKGFQELLKKQKNIKSLDFKYFSVLEDVLSDNLNIEYPAILKTVNGSSSRGVYKVQNKMELINTVKKNSQETIKSKALFYLKKNFISKITAKYNDDYFKESKNIKRFVLQEFAEGNNEDWKVLIFDSKYFVLNRKAKKGDFKASGSGIRNFNDPSEELLSYAKYIFDKLDVPFISMDIVVTNEGFELIEFQATHFGLYTIMKSSSYFTLENNIWTKINSTSDASIEYVNSIINYYKKEGN
ncbi:hypothetical protein ACRPK8_03005 [Exiguobacterium sp. TDN 0502]|uniref:hypothetical protein n=1 Tax=Exiguobacterium sp. TDN 0502 TaxID=3420731 RepID=UPI003D77A5F5